MKCERNCDPENSIKSVLLSGAVQQLCAILLMELIEPEEPMKIVGLDNMNDYYDVSLEEYCLAHFEKMVAEDE